jgi:hypothetical protein
VFLAFYIGFGILAGIWPLHTWSPDGHASAPTAVSMLHAGVLMKLGAYGLVRLGIGLLPDASVEWAWLVGTIACINIAYGALSAMAQTDLKYVIAYSSVSHMGVVMLGAADRKDIHGAIAHFNSCNRQASRFGGRVTPRAQPSDVPTVLVLDDVEVQAGQSNFFDRAGHEYTPRLIADRRGGRLPTGGRCSPFGRHGRAGSPAPRRGRR